MKTELIFFWFATVLYGISTFFYIASLLSKKEKMITYGISLIILGFIAQTLFLFWYWITLGGDAMTLHAYTAVSRISGTAWMGVLVFLIVQLFVKSAKPAGVLIMPITFLLQVWAGFSGKEIGTIPAVHATGWFWIHISSGGSAYGFLLISGAAGLLYLLKDKNKLQIADSKLFEEQPELKILDDLNYRFVALGFVMLSIMMISGALWANQAHGRYWGWDPIEVQSLVSWLLYAIWLHLRLTFGWRGRRLAWYSLFLLIVVGINLTGVPFIEKVFHSGFRIQHQ